MAMEAANNKPLLEPVPFNSGISAKMLSSN
jgi:hypothetical protein